MSQGLIRSSTAIWRRGSNEHLPETPTATEAAHCFFTVPEGVLPYDASVQDRLLHRVGRKP